MFKKLVQRLPKTEKASFSAQTSQAVLQFCTPYKKYLFVGGIALIGATAVNLSIPQLIRFSLGQPWSTGLIGELATWLVVLFALQALCFFVRSFYFYRFGHHVVNDIRRYIFKNIVHQPIAFFDTHQTGDLVSRLSGDASLVQETLSVKASIVLRYGLQMFGGLVLMALLSVKLTALTLLAIPVLVLLSLRLVKQLRQLTKVQQAKLGEAGTIAEETAYGIRTVQATSQESYEHRRFGAAIEAALLAAIERSRLSAFFQAFMSFLMNLLIVCLVLIGVLFVHDGKLASGDLVAFFLYAVIVAVSFAFLMSAIGDIFQALGAAERLFELRLPDDSITVQEKTSPSPSFENITFSEVSFAYPARPETLVLEKVSCVLPSKQKTALVGHSGAGKSTLVHLLLGFYEPVHGEIVVDGKSLAMWPKSALRKPIAFVPQEPIIFSSSLAENIAYGAPHVTSEEIRSVASEARLDDLLSRLPAGLETPVGPHGVQLSGGEKQRIAIARAMLREPQLLILDEATSALDSENEERIQDALHELLQGKTALIIAHRLSTIRSADHIIVLHQGKVVQQGSHGTLSNQTGVYQDLVLHQQL